MIITAPLIFLLQTIVFPGIVFFIILALLSDWFYRKVYARIQLRIGPKIAGPAGILQSLADFIKTAIKEEIVPRTANKWIFKLLPIFAPVPIIIGLFFIPIVSDTAFLSSPGDFYMIIFILTSFAAIQITLGWASGSKFALIGASRAGLQLVSFGIPLIFAMLIPVIKAESFSFVDIVNDQTGTYFGFIPQWNIFGIGFIAFMIFIIATLAELEKPPFDTPEAETEIAGGWTLEYSGRLYAFIILAENLKIVFLTSLAVTLFLGGPIGPTFGITGIGLGILYFIYFSMKYIFVLTIITFISASMARFKVKQIVYGTWSWLAPIAILTVLLLMLVGV
jgi:NADH-quinone oxidoreductase subunit H